MPEKCALSHGSGVLDAILVTVFAFGALMWKKCAQSHSFGLGRVGGGGGGSYILYGHTADPNLTTCSNEGYSIRPKPRS